jgi:hypothetical protein
MRIGAERLAAAVIGALFREDAPRLYASMIKYEDGELASTPYYVAPGARGSVDRSA